MNGASIGAAQVVCGGVGTKPWRLAAAEAALKGARPDEAAGQKAAARSLGDFGVEIRASGRKEEDFDAVIP